MGGSPPAGESSATRTPEPSGSRDVIELLIEKGMIDPPSHPGLLGDIEGFAILRVIGEGGMGVIMLARDPMDGRAVAIKMMRPELVNNKRLVERFLKEAKHLSQLSHPNILPVLRVMDRPASPAFVVPYLAGGSLAERLAVRGAMDERDIHPIAQAMAAALACAHRGGITHRDLKPSNVLFDEGGRVFLADFGLCRTVFNDESVDPRHIPLEGTTSYLAPEIVRGEAGDTRCDIYSWGALVYEMLAGRPPYSGGSTSEVAGCIKAGPPTPITELAPQASNSLVCIVSAAMARDLRHRYASFEDVLADLALAQRGESPVNPVALRYCQGLRQRRLVRWLAVGLVLAMVATWAVRWVKNRDVLLREDFGQASAARVRWNLHHTDQFGQSRAGNTRSLAMRDGRLNIIVSAMRNGEPSASEVAWVDVPVDLAAVGDSTIEVDLDATGANGGCALLLTDGSAPVDVHCSNAMPLFLSDAPESGAFTLPTTRVQASLSRDSLAAQVRISRGGRTSSTSMPLPSTAPWRLRLMAWSQDLPGLQKGQAQLRIDRIEIRRASPPARPGS